MIPVSATITAQDTSPLSAAALLHADASAFFGATISHAFADADNVYLQAAVAYGPENLNLAAADLSALLATLITYQ